MTGISILMKDQQPLTMRNVHDMLIRGISLAYPEHPDREISAYRPAAGLHTGRPIAPRNVEMPRMNAAWPPPKPASAKPIANFAAA